MPAGLNRSGSPAQASIAYTSESIKLTTRLTQLASWLLVRRAIAMGEITAAEAHTHRHKVTLVAQSSMPPECFDELPETFKRLIRREPPALWPGLAAGPALERRLQRNGRRRVAHLAPDRAHKLEFPAA